MTQAGGGTPGAPGPAPHTPATPQAPAATTAPAAPGAPAATDGTSSSDTQQGTGATRARAEALLTFIVDEMLARYGYDNVSRDIWRRFNADGQRRTVVVVGEVARGKSTLANALMGTRDASPEGVALTTSTAVAIGPATEELPAGRALLFYPDHNETVPAAELGRWVTKEAHTLNSETREDAPTRAFVAVDSPALGDITVIDTPGVGGLNEDHAALATSSATQANVLVIAVDASTPITSGEMEFIRRTGAGLGVVIVAVTKTDKNLTRWREIAEKDRELLREHLDRDIPVIGVSSLLATAPAAVGADREAAVRASGIEELRGEITERFTHAEDLPAINGLRTAVDGLRALDAQLAEEHKVAAAGAEALPELSEKMEQLRTLKREAEQWEHYLNRDMTMARQEALGELDARLQEIRESWHEKIRKKGMKVLRSNAQYFTGEIEKDFRAAVLEAAETYSRLVRDNIVAPRFEDPLIWNDIEEDIAKAVANQEFQTGEVKSKGEGVFDPMMLMMGFSGGTMIGTVLGTAISFTGLGLVAGAGWIAFNVGFRAMRAGKNNLMNWIRETTAATKVFTNRRLETITANARPAIVIRYREYLRTTTETVQRQIREAEAAAKRDRQQRERNLARLKKNRQVIAKNIARAEDLIKKLEVDA
ncbi:dynamin family protein [Corynebacterium frankenforstense]